MPGQGTTGPPLRHRCPPPSSPACPQRRGAHPGPASLTVLVVGAFGAFEVSSPSSATAVPRVRPGQARAACSHWWGPHGRGGARGTGPPVVGGFGESVAWSLRARVEAMGSWSSAHRPLAGRARGAAPGGADRRARAWSARSWGPSWPAGPPTGGRGDALGIQQGCQPWAGVLSVPPSGARPTPCRGGPGAPWSAAATCVAGALVF